MDIRNSEKRLNGGGGGFGQGDVLYAKIGTPMGYFNGLKTDGIFQNQSEVDSYPTLNNSVQAGDLRFVDINNDGVIDDEDKTNLEDKRFNLDLGINGIHKFPENFFP